MNFFALPFIYISTLLIFIAKQWSWRGPSVYKSTSENFTAGSIHSLLGTIAILIAILQPLLALMRCQPDTGARPIFNWTHRSLGIIGIVLSYLKNKAPSKTIAMEMQNRSSHRYDDTGKVINIPPKIINLKPLYGVTMMYVLFTLFCFCVTALLITMLST
ncbi:hypothetical protein DICVIV_06082 [Dictyocaulus viviparus]|uniref:Cytochrome b561 domain-containing protein n=1 Tax=Dictyocaulus viviparus TaxID=29172 RepID=A0A0D8XZT0_DICVI|nr:hypothetical protein DICVIV_06082 [Dictyocaulus viviparus]